ncbi:MAG: MEDS domain-containing protein [Candidatus Omnitrophica bacterium]|nr:MEDS domain-containing protein [Candidatus Omnitrophota bacterium]
MGKHDCLFYSTTKDLYDMVGPFFQQGLAKKEYCMWIVSATSDIDFGKAMLRERIPGLDDHLQKKDIDIIYYKTWYTTSGSFDMAKVLKNWTDKLEDVGKKGYSGIRVSADALWCTDVEWDKLLTYEKTVHDMILQSNITALCAYPMHKVDEIKMLRLGRFHGITIRKKDEALEAMTNSSASDSYYPAY